MKEAQKLISASGYRMIVVDELEVSVSRLISLWRDWRLALLMPALCNRLVNHLVNAAGRRLPPRRLLSLTSCSR